MNKYILILLLWFPSLLPGQVFDVDTILYHGDSDKLINLVILGDGFTENEQDQFIDASIKVSEHIFKLKPWNHYKEFFNVFAIKVISEESGVVHPVTAPDCPGDMPHFSANTYFNTTFDYFDIHRLVVPTRDARIGQVLAANFPNYDQVMILSNSTYYGGSGGTFATSTLHSQSPDIMIHEMGHSFAKLADEYYAGDFYASEKVNMTQNTDPNSVKWKAWLNTSDVGIYQHCCGGASESWYRPHQNCKMRNLSADFCPVCSEAIVETIHSKVNPIIGYLPEIGNIEVTVDDLVFELTQLLKPQPNTLKITWYLNNEPVLYDDEQFTISPADLSIGKSVIRVEVIDTTELLRIDNHAAIHSDQVSWTVNKEAASNHISIDQDALFSFKVFPNPAKDHINIELDASVSQAVVVFIRSVSNSSILVQQDFQLVNGRNHLKVDVSQHSSGNYVLEFGNQSVYYVGKVQIVK